MRRWILWFFVLVPAFVFAAPPSEWISKSTVYAKCVGTGGNTNTSSSGSGSDFAHNLSCTTDAYQLKANSTVRACAHVALTTNSSGVPQLSWKLKSGSAGTTLLAQSDTPTAPAVSLSGMNNVICFRTVIGADPGASVNTYTSFETYPSATTFTSDSNSTSQPVALATNGALVFTFVSRWESAGSGTNSVSLLSFTVEVTR